MEPRPHERGNGLKAEWSGRVWLLQWSHFLTNVETSPGPLNPRKGDSASMEPRPHERGNRSARFAPRSPTGSFNGATSSRTWKHADGDEEQADERDASMEPRPHERGNRRQVRAARRRGFASMEPRPHERGNSSFRRLVHLVLLLQWSHVLTNVETGQRPARSSPGTALQWSHVLTNVETACRVRLPRVAVLASMEPRPHERGNEHHGWNLENNLNASMEPRPHERGNAISACHAAGTRPLQWSHEIGRAH